MRNQALLTVADQGDSGGLTVTARLKVWSKRNLNAETYEPTAYDEFITDYYGRGDLNMPLTLMHGQRVEDIIGKVTTIEKDEEGLTVTAQVMDGLPMSETVKTLISAGVLQGMSDEGYADDFDYDEKDGFRIRKAAMLAISLVTTPAESLAKVSVANAIKMTGFTPEGEGRLRRRKR